MKWFYRTLIIVLAAGCIDPVKLATKSAAGNLVVDGWLTDDQPKCTITLSRSVKYDDSQVLKVYSVPEKHANVQIIDDLGVKTSLVEISDGRYQTDEIIPVVGRTYQLLMQTSDGKSYKSSPETMLPFVPIDTIKAKYEQTRSLFTNANGDAKIQVVENFALTVKLHDPKGVKNFYRWKLDGIFEFFSSSEDPVKAPNHCWAPKPRLETKLEISDDSDFDGNRYERRVGVIVYDRPTFFLVTARQQSLSPGAYEFLKKISAQQTSTASLFDPPPSMIAGNISGPTDSDLVYGYFGVSSVGVSKLLVNRFRESGVIPAQNFKILPGDCRTMEPFATNIKPPGFP